MLKKVCKKLWALKFYTYISNILKMRIMQNTEKFTILGFNAKTIKNFTLLSFCISMVISILSMVLYFKSKPNYILNVDTMTIGSEDWKDSIFTDYEMRAEIYLQKYPTTPIKSEMLKLAAWNTYDSTGILLPLELALAQAQLESGMGLTGRSPTNNPYNVGEHDNGTVLWFDSTFDGIQAYYYLMANRYLKGKSLNTLLKNFVDINGYRYASNPNYEESLKDMIAYIEKYINNRIDQE